MSATGKSTLTLRVSADSYLGDPEFVVLVDGVQVGGVLTATASHAQGGWQDVTISGDFAADPGAVSVQFLNDAWGGSAAQDRNLYVASLTLNGQVYAGASAQTSSGTFSQGTGAALYCNGSVTFQPDSTITLNVSEDAYLGDAQFIVYVNGQQVGGVQTATASHAAGQWQQVTLSGEFGSDPRQVSVQFLNDAWGGSAAADRNLYVGSVAVNGAVYAGSSADNEAGGGPLSDGSTELASNGTASFQLTSTISFDVSEDAFQGNAVYRVLVNGVQQGGDRIVQADHASGAWETVNVTGDFGSAPDQVSIQLLNAAGSGSAGPGSRDLYVRSLTLNGQTYPGVTADNKAGGQTVNDATVLTTDGSVTFLSGSTPSTAAAPLPGLSFASNQYASLGNTLQFDSNQSWSVATDIEVGALPPGPSNGLPGGGASLVFGNTNGAPYQGYEMWIDDTGALRVRIMSNFLAGDYIDVAGVTDVADGRMHFIGASYDGSFTAAGVKLYVDGVQEQTRTLSDTLSGSSASNGPMILGNQLNGWQDQFQLRGDMFDFALSNVARDPSYFAQGSATASAPDHNTMAAFDFRNRSGLTVADLSGNGNNAQLSSSSMWA